MALPKKQTYFETNKMVYINLDEIVPNPNQPRKIFDLKGLEELAASIARHGVLQPLSVRRTALGYELVAGERRLRASRLAGLRQAPCIVLDIDSQQSSLLALVENLQRRDLDYMEEAEGLARLIRLSGCSQEEAARKIGKSQSAVANKLRLLRLSPTLITKLRQNALSERHARALLRLANDAERETVLEAVLKQDMNVARTESYIDEFIARRDRTAEAAPARQQDAERRKLVLRDVRLFLNSVDRGLELLRHSGIAADCARQETEQGLVLTITLAH